MGTCAAPGRRFRRVFSINSSIFQRNRRKSRVENLNEQIACEQALLFGQAKRGAEEGLRRSLARSRETRFIRPNRRACSQAICSFKFSNSKLEFYI